MSFDCSLPALLGNEGIRLGTQEMTRCGMMAADAPEMADLIVIGTNQKRGVNLLGSVSRGVLHHASMNVLCVPTGAADATKATESKGGTD